MAWTVGLEIGVDSFYSLATGNNRAFKSQINNIIMGDRGNKVIDGVTGSVVDTDLTSSGNHYRVAAGTVSVAGDLQSVVLTNVDLSGAHGALASGQERYVMVYVDSAGTVQSTNGSISTTDTAIPPDVVEDSVTVAIIYLSYGDNTFSADQIEDRSIISPPGS